MNAKGWTINLHSHIRHAGDLYIQREHWVTCQYVPVQAGRHRCQTMATGYDEFTPSMITYYKDHLEDYTYFRNQMTELGMVTCSSRSCNTGLEPSQADSTSTCYL